MMKEKLKNPHYVARSMQIIDIQHAFGMKSKLATKRFIYDVLIHGGWVHKRGDRHFMATPKLLNLAFLPDELQLIDFQSRYFSYNETFSYTDLVDILEGNYTVVNRLIHLNYLLLQKNGSYRKSTTFEESLAEGEDTFPLNL